MISVSKSKKRNLATHAQTEHSVHANVQVDEIVSFENFCKHIAEHGSKYGVGDAYAVLTEASECLREFMLDGKKVELGSLGAFRPSVSSKGADSYAEFTANNIAKVNVVWERGNNFKDLRREAEFLFVPIRDVQTLLKKAQASGEVPDDLTDRLSGNTGTPADDNTDNTGNTGDGSGTGSGNDGGTGGNGGGSSSYDDEP